MNKRIFFSLLLVIVLGCIGFWLLRSPRQQQAPINTYADCAKAGYPVLESSPEVCTTPDGKTFTNNISVPPPAPAVNANQKTDKIIVDNLLPNQTIKNPLTVTGSAIGNWYFEGSFPVELLDADGESLGKVSAKAQGTWMTTDFVPFTITLKYTKPTTPTGTLVLHKDNPSGDPTLDDTLRIPVHFTDIRPVRM